MTICHVHADLTFGQIAHGLFRGPDHHGDMLRYLGLGERRYGERPVRPYARTHWEFQAVIKGVCVPDGPGLTSLPRGMRLWVFPPGHLHGWTAPPASICHVVVMHLTFVPETLRQACEATAPPVLEIPLNASQASRLADLGRQADRDLRQPDGYSTLRQQRLWCDLSLMVLEALPGSPPPPPPRVACDVVDAAVAWLSNHLQEGPSIHDAARAVHTSTAHLRRLFHQAEGGSPQEVLQRLRLERAESLLQQDRLSLDAIARACGLADGASLSRWYRRHRGRPPSHHRRIR